VTIVVDANVAIAVLDPADHHHEAAIRRCLEAGEVAILNLTRAEALIHPTRLGRFAVADAELERLGFVTHVLDHDVADRARQLRASYGNRNFPMVDAVVVAFGIERSWSVVTADQRWPRIAEATIEDL
jgi:predicted nucleic acid-binding protein